MRSATVITARLGSSRLPRKMLADVGGATSLEVLVRRLRHAQRPEMMVLATTAESEDDELAAAATQLGVTVFRGPTNDILERWRQAAEEYEIDLLVTCDGDDLFCDAEYVDAIVGTHQRTGAEYITCVELPFGAAPTGVARSGLERVCSRKRETDTEGQGRFFAAEGIVTRAELKADRSVRHPSCRMTLDYPQDLVFFRTVLAELTPDPCPSLQQIVALLRNRPDIVAINSGLQEEYWARFHVRYQPVEMDS
jgi:spore coat polysaccharide biosynthesis protein SpsF (cytidylyltransferase family)